MALCAYSAGTAFRLSPKTIARLETPYDPERSLYQHRERRTTAAKRQR